MPDVVVIGAGISGLTCAWQIRRAGLDVTVLEASDRPGGVIQTHQIDGYMVESGPNTILPTPAALEILKASGLSETLVAAPPKSPRFIYLNGRLRRVPWVLSLGGALRILREPFVRGPKTAGDESLASFFSRRFGDEVQERLIAPFVAGIYAGDTNELSLESTFPRLRELEDRYGSVVLGMLRGARAGPRSRLSSFEKGMETLPTALAHDLDIRYGVGGTRLHVGWSVESKAVGLHPKAVVLAVPVGAASELLRPLDSGLSKAFETVPYAGLLVAASGVNPARMEAPPSGFGFLIPRTEGLHTLGTLFSSSLFPNRAPEGRVLLTTFLGGALEPEVVDWTDARVWETVESELSAILGVHGDLSPLALFRYRQAIPQYRLGHAAWRDDVLRRIQKHKGLFLAGNYLNGVSVPASMEQGRRAAAAAIEYVRRNS